MAVLDQRIDGDLSSQASRCYSLHSEHRESGALGPNHLCQSPVQSEYPVNCLRAVVEHPLPVRSERHFKWQACRLVAKRRRGVGAGPGPSIRNQLSHLHRGPRTREGHQLHGLCTSGLLPKQVSRCRVGSLPFSGRLLGRSKRSSKSGFSGPTGRGIGA